MIARRFIVGATLALLALAPARAAVLIHEYILKDGLSAGTGAALEGIGGKIDALGYVFAGQPFSLGTSVPIPANISVEYSFKFQVAGQLVAGDFTANPVPGKIEVAGPLVLQTTPGAVERSVPLTVVVTRDSASNLLTGYVNGQTEFVINQDVSGNATRFNASFAFSMSNAAGQVITPFLGGHVDSVRIYNGVLTAAEVRSLYVAEVPLAIPEPSTYALMGVGVIALYFNRRRRKSRIGRE